MGIARFVGWVVVSIALCGCWSGVVWFGKSPDRAREIAVLQNMAGQHVRVDGKDEKAYLGIGVEGLSWSPDGGKLAYPARVSEGWVLVVEGKEGPVADGIGEVVWSGDGKHISYSVERKGRWLVVRDGHEEPTLEALRARSLRFSADGAHLAYVGDEDKKVVAVVDGVKSRPFDAIGHFVFGRDGRWAFAARRGADSVIVADGKESTAYEDVADLAFSPGGERLAWTARRGGAWWVVEGLNERGPFARVSKLVWAPRGETLAFGVGDADGERVVNGGVLGAKYEGVLPGSLAFDATGKHLVYAARQRHAWRVVMDEVESPPYEDMEAPVFVGESSAVAFVARRGEATFVVIDGHAGPVVADASGLVMSPDGRRFLHTARSGLRVAVVEGEVVGGACGEGRCSPKVTRTWLHDTVVGGTLVWSESGNHHGYLSGSAAARRLVVVVDGVAGAELDLAELMAGVSIAPDLAGALTGDSKVLADWVRAEVTLAEARDAESQRRASRERAKVIKSGARQP